MVIVNYPESYIRQSTSTTIPTTQIVEEPATSPDTSSSKIGQRVITPDMKQREKNKIKRELAREGLDVDRRSGKVVPKGYYYTNTGELRKEGPKYKAQLIETTQGKEILIQGKVPSEALKQKIEQYETRQAIQQTSRDVTYTTEGQGVSKAYELQTPKEKEQTAIFTSQLKSTSGGIEYEQRTNNIQTTKPTFTSSSSSQLYNANVYDDRSFKGYTSRIDVAPKGFNYQYEVSKVLGLESLQSPVGKLFVSAYGLAEGGVRGTFGLVKAGYSGVKAVTIDFPKTYKKVSGFTGEVLSGDYSKIKSFGEDLRAKGYSFGEQLYQQPEYTISRTVGEVVVPSKVLDVTLTGAKNVYVATGSKYVPESKVFSSQVLSEGKKFPLATSTEQALQKFNVPTPEGKIIVSTASPGKIRGTMVEEGFSAKYGREDPGIFVTPKGEGSPAFLGVSKQAGYEFTFNPLKPVKEFFKTPGVTEFEVRGVLRQPRVVVAQPGFESTRKFFELEGSKTGYAYITKRSELGQGELSKQFFNPIIREELLPFKFKSDKIVKEAGTTEIEAVVPFKAKFEYETPKTFIGKLKDYEEYTTYQGRAIPIRKGKVLSDTDILSTTDKGITLKTGTVKEAYVESSQALSTKKSISPASSLKYSSTIDASSISSTPSKISSEYGISSDTSRLSSSTPTSTSISSASDISKLSSVSITPESPTSITPSSSPSISSVSIISYPSIPSTPSKPTPSKIPEYIPESIPTTFKGLEKPKKKGKRTELFVKKKGKFELKGISEDNSLLFKKGFDITRGTASASFKVVEEGKTLLRSNILPTDFTRSKRTEGVIVQKREKRISSAGEKFEITRKGIATQRARRLI